ncbi:MULTISPECIES: hypothetical protein [unclassified Pseudoalteromonas]|uniref:hypothetical protein n=1 Tax=unclassified Pseudoalteromonas TaxID=194690 RepID=UPI0004663200|nr:MULTISPECIES: hypothetical protein [unclassified Pseudoalteromonas]TMP50258.1 hypothetical protein CWB81_11245 [Pseudoalteromonas sp. S1688]
MTNSRVPQLRMVEHLASDNITVGLATVVSAKKNSLDGWALPGCRFTTNRDKAHSVCAKMHYLIEGLGGIKPAEKINRAA